MQSKGEASTVPIDPRFGRRMPRRSLAACLWAAVVFAPIVTLLACVTPPYIEPFEARLARPGPGEVVLVEDSVIIFDGSGSIDPELLFPAEKALLESFVMGMPPGLYRSALYVLGQSEKHQLPLTRFERFHLRQRAHRLGYGGLETPLADLLGRLVEPLEGRTGRAALIIFSDGVPTRYGKYVGPEDTLAAARRLRDRHSGQLCYHMIQLGADARAPVLLEQLAGLTQCGSYQTLESLSNPEALHALQQSIYNGPAPPPEPARPRHFTDLDRDGVDDRFDRCPRTPIGARVDERGCWTIEDYVFEVDRAEIRADQEAALDQVAAVLVGNPELRVRLDGHTDDRGTAAYNFDLAERRARAISDHLIASGIDPERLEIRGFGATRPIASNETESGRRKNRRVELSIVDW